MLQLSMKNPASVNKLEIIQRRQLMSISVLHLQKKKEKTQTKQTKNSVLKVFNIPLI